MVISKEYERWIAELALRFRSSQIKAAVKVNDEMLRFYWSVGEDIEKRHFDNRYGSHFYENVSKDLRKALGITRGLSSTTIKYTHKYYLLYNQLVENRQQVVDDFTTASLQHPDSILQIIFRIPWAHHILIIDNVNGDPLKALFFVRKVMENNWSRAVLQNFLSSNLYERQGAAQTNFSITMPAQDGDLAQELLKSPYDFSFLPGKEKYKESELKDSLIEHIAQFLVELGKGFSYVGKEYRLTVGGKDRIIDLLFYVIPLHRYCVIEVKITEFDFPDLGQLAGYVAMVDDMMNTELEKPAIGLLICKEKNTELAQYALSTINRPIGISEYDIAYQPLPEDLRRVLPSPEEIVRGLKRKAGK